MLSYEKVIAVATAVMAFSTVLGMGGAIAYYFFAIVTSFKPIVLLITILYILVMVMFTWHISHMLRWKI